MQAWAGPHTSGVSEHQAHARQELVMQFGQSIYIFALLVGLPVFVAMCGHGFREPRDQQRDGQQQGESKARFHEGVSGRGHGMDAAISAAVFPWPARIASGESRKEGIWF